MAKVKTTTNGRRYVDIDGVIERRLQQLKKAHSNGNGHAKPEGSSKPASSPSSIKEGKIQSIPAR